MLGTVDGLCAFQVFSGAPNTNNSVICHAGILFQFSCYFLLLLKLCSAPADGVKMYT